MARTIGIGIQSFEKIIRNQYLYIDKTSFIRQWWESGDEVTLITRPRRFWKDPYHEHGGAVFSPKYAGRGDLFEGLAIWREEEYRALQGTYPVISLSFANVKERDYDTARRKICHILADLYTDYAFLLESDILGEGDKEFFRRVTMDMGDVEATLAIHNLCRYLSSLL